MVGGEITAHNSPGEREVDSVGYVVISHHEGQPSLLGQVLDKPEGGEHCLE